MILIYVRHAVAMDRDDFAKYCIEKGLDADDEQRPLTAEGRRKMKKNAEGLVTALHSFSDSKAGVVRGRPLIISSPLVRAVDTAAILAQAFERPTKSKRKVRGKRGYKPDLVTPTLSPGQHPKEFRDYLYDLLHSRSVMRTGRTHVNTVVMAIGHEPQLSTSIGWWMIGKEKSRFPFKKGGATCLEIGNALAPGEARLLWSLPPWALRSL